MKKRILILGITLSILTLMSFGFLNWRETKIKSVKPLSSMDVAMDQPYTEDQNKSDLDEFFFDVDSRFGTTLTKEDLKAARSINDILSKEMTQGIVTYKSISVIILEDDKQTDIKETGYSDILTDAQRKLLSESDYSTNFLIRTDYQQKNKETGVLEDSYSTPYITIVPEKQAEYIDGKDIFLAYLKEKSEKSRANVQADKLQAAKLYFTVSKKGAIVNIRLDRTSNYPAVDKTMIELISNAPGKWLSAENSNGEKVDQELVISFGLMGC